jgi:hypothetical protein
MVRVAVFEDVPSVAVMVAPVLAVTLSVGILKLAEVAFAATVTLAGTVALEVLDTKFTTAPPGPAGPFSVTVPVDGAPPTTEVGTTLRPVKAADVIASVADFVPAPNVAEIVADVELETAAVLTVNVPVVEPTAIVTLLGGTALDVLEVSSITMPPLGAGPLSVTVPVKELPPITELGESVMLTKLAGLIVRTACFDVLPKLAVIVA